MSNKTARIVAIIALVFMAAFVVFLVLTIIDIKMLGGSVGIIAMITGFVAIGLYLWLRFAGKTYNLSKMKDEAEMQRIQDELDKQALDETNAKAEEGTALENAAEEDSSTEVEATEDSVPEAAPEADIDNSSARKEKSNESEVEKHSNTTSAPARKKSSK